MRFTICFLFSIVFISGCIIEETQTPEEIAQSIIITYTSGPNIKNGETLSFVIENETIYCFDFSPNYNVSINIEIDGAWINIPNNINFINVNDKPNILMPKNDPGAMRFVNALPDISNYEVSNPVKAYVLISGHVCENEKILVEKKIPFTITP